MEGRFWSLDQTHSEFEWNLAEIMIQVVLVSPESSKDQIKKEKKKEKRSFPQIWHYIRPELVGFIRANIYFFVWWSNAEISMEGR